MVILSSKGMEKIEKIQDKYRFMNNFALEQSDIYEFCNSILKAYYLGLCLDDEDLKFIENVYEKISE